MYQLARAQHSYYLGGICPLSGQKLLIYGNPKIQDNSRPEIAMQKKKHVGTDHADNRRHQAAEECIQEGDFVLLVKRKENKLSP